MTLAVCWLVLPALLATFSLGCGLLLERAAGFRLPAPLLIPAGFALLIVAAQFATATDATAELALPLAIALAVAGLARPGWWRDRDLEPWAGLAAVGTFAVFAAPVVLSGEATFAGYYKLDDTSTWFALTDRVIEHGRSVEGLPPSSYEAVLSFNLAQGYPIGTFLPLGIASKLVGQDVAWTFQPYLAFLAAALALTLATLARRIVESSRLRALAAFIAAQAALLLGYALWGGAKELASAVIVALLAALLHVALQGRRGPREMLPLAVAVSAAAALMSPAGALLWMGPLFAPALMATVSLRRGDPGLRQWLWLALLIVPLAVPWLIDAGFVPPTWRPVTSETARGALVEPLSALQIFGVWPAGDFRTDPAAPGLTYALIALVAGAAVFGLLRAWQRRAWGLLLYVEGAAVGALLSQVVTSPWVAAKGLAIASPAPLLAAVCGVAVLVEGGRRLLPAVAGAAIAAGVLWSSFLAYHDVHLAPRERLAELERLGERISGSGPTLVAEFEPYATRHFLRDADPEGVSDLRRRTVPLRTGGTPCGLAGSPGLVTCVPKGDSADPDWIRLDALLAYRTVVLRRSPATSRPPTPYRRTWSGRYYEVWQRPERADRRVIEHLTLPPGAALYPTAVPSCEEIERLADLAGDREKLAFVPRAGPIVSQLPVGGPPAGWGASGTQPGGLVPSGSDAFTALLRVPEEERYAVWLGGAPRGRASVTIDGAPVGALDRELTYPGHFTQVGTASLRRGNHDVEVRYEEGGLRPGTTGRRFSIGPVALSRPDPELDVSTIRPERANALCGRELDWVELIDPNRGR